jgi:hypothetical protein
MAQVFPDVLVAPVVTTGTTDARHYSPLTPNVFRFVPVRLRYGFQLRESKCETTEKHIFDLHSSKQNAMMWLSSRICILTMPLSCDLGISHDNPVLCCVCSNRDLTRIHGLNERVHASDSANCIRFFYQLIRNANEFSEFDF